NALCEGKNGELWIGVEGGGLFCLTHGRLERFQKTDGLAKGNVKTIYAAGNGDIWIGASGGLSRFENGKLRAYTTADGLVDNDIRSIVEDDDGLLWIGTPRGLNTFKHGSISAVYTNLNERPDRYGIPDKSVTALCQDGTGGLWIGTANGMVHRRGGDFRDHFRSDNFGLSDNSIAALCRDRKGVLWIGTSAGLNCWAEGNACITLLDHDGSGFDQIHAICEDIEGDIWAGGKEGLRRLRPKVFTTYGQQAGFTHNNIMSVREDEDDAMWVAILGGGLNRFKDGNITTYSMGPVLRTDLILSTCERRDGSIWFGADHGFGLYYLEQKTLKHYNLKKGSLQSPVRVIHEDRQNNLWLGDGNELTLVQKGKLTHYKVRDGLAGNVVQAILEDHQGNLWFGTDGGLSQWKDGRFVNFRTEQGLSVNSIDALHEDNGQTLWIGTIGGGLNQFRNGKFRSYTTSQGLFSDDVLEILEDNYGSLWLSCFNGVFRVRKQSLDDFDRGIIKEIPCASYGKADGMASSQCNGVAKPAGWKDKSGKLWFPTTKGLVVADPNTPYNDIPPPVMIEEILADKQKPGLNSPDTPEKPLRIKPGRGELEFHYTALSLQESEQNRFKYKLEGFDPEWVEAGSRRVAYYDNLQPGRYQFHVIACNNDGIWNETGEKVAFVLLPHFWQTAWFFGLATLSAVGALAGLVRYLTSRKLHRELAVLGQQHAVEQERSRIAQDMHDDLGARLSEVLLLSDLTRKNGGEPEQVRVLTGKISHAARDLVDNLDALVWAVNPKNDSLDMFADYVGENAALYLETSGVRCIFELPPKLPSLPLSSEVRHNLFLVVKEALHNVVKHAAASEARISLSIDDGILILRIADNGKGFAGNTNSRSGNGLINMEDRMKKIGASFQIAGHPGKGTQITVKLPVAPAAQGNKPAQLHAD
ncbi:MAG TPA: two-component regulator propeller domain-containing protein, partial [Verrucomicrobiae bacterium]|nr:two-component regulator propeller domain-containing protein [Verrucomicrobiae bacterium]